MRLECAFNTRNNNKKFLIVNPTQDQTLRPWSLYQWKYDKEMYDSIEYN